MPKKDTAGKHPRYIGAQPHRLHQDQKATVLALGLHRICIKRFEHKDTPALRGMLTKSSIF